MQIDALKMETKWTDRVQRTDFIQVQTVVHSLQGTANYSSAFSVSEYCGERTHGLSVLLAALHAGFNQCNLGTLSCYITCIAFSYYML